MQRASISDAKMCANTVRKFDQNVYRKPLELSLTNDVSSMAMLIDDVKDAGQVSARAALRAKIRERLHVIPTQSHTQSAAGTVHAASNERTKGQCLILALPAELRNKIYVMSFEPLLETEVQNQLDFLIGTRNKDVAMDEVTGSMAALTLKPKSASFGSRIGEGGLVKSIQTQAVDKAPIHFLNDLNPPPLARVCRQIRTECLPIFLQSVDIHVQLSEVESGLVMRMLRNTLTWLRAEGHLSTSMRKVHLHFDGPVRNKSEMFFNGQYDKDMEYVIEAQRFRTPVITHGHGCVLCANVSLEEKFRDYVIPSDIDKLSSQLNGQTSCSIEHLKQSYELVESSHERDINLFKCLIPIIKVNHGHGISVDDVACFIRKMDSRTGGTLGELYTHNSSWTRWCQSWALSMSRGILDDIDSLRRDTEWSRKVADNQAKSDARYTRVQADYFLKFGRCLILSRDGI